MKIALLGFGTVGSGFYKLLNMQQGALQLCAVLARRPLPQISCMVTSDFYKILNEANADIIVEAMGGLEPAHEYIAAALNSKKHVVTANKQLMCAYYDELTALARANGVALRCTAAAGGGIPWLSSLARAASVDSIDSVCGIMNGTSNYILDSMHHSGADYAAALKEAQRLGYAEADPTADVCGYDTRRKLVLSANVAFGVSINENAVPCRGIAEITAQDIRFFNAHGFTCKLIGRAQKQPNAISARVAPELFPAGAAEAMISECGNIFTLHGEHIGSQSFSGAGAGAYPTGSNVLADCLAISNGCAPFYVDSFAPAALSMGAERRRYYLRSGDTQRISDALCAMEAAALYAELGAGAFIAAINE